MKDLIAKSNHVVEASYRLTLNEQRLVLLCVQQIKKGKPISAQDSFTVLASEFADMFGIALDGAYSELQAVADKLYERSVTIYQPDPEYPKLTHTKTRWISSIDYIPDEGRVRLYFAAKMIPYISMLEGGFTRYNIEHIAKMSSVYSIRFYELFKCWLFGGSSKVKTVGLDELKGLLDLKDEKGAYQYPSIKDFKLYVLNKAMSEINEHSDLKVSYEDKKTGRKITHLVFTFVIKVREGGEVPAPKKAVKLTRAYIEKHARPGETYEQAEQRLRGKPL